MKPFAWSFSALSCYELCPKKYFHLYVAEKGSPQHFKDADNSFAADGKIIHDAFRKRVVDGVAFPLPMRHFERIAKPFADAKGEKHGEMRLALNRNMEPVDYFAADVWVRANIDLAIVQKDTAIIVDWKTGKVKPDDFTQIGLSAAVLARWMPELGMFKTMFAWVAHNKISPHNYTLSKLTAVWNDLIPRANKIETARQTTDFPAKPGKLCGYCPVTTCPHYVARDE